MNFGSLASWFSIKYQQISLKDDTNKITPISFYLLIWAAYI